MLSAYLIFSYISNRHFHCNPLPASVHILPIFMIFQIEIFIASLCLAQVAGYSCPEEEFGFLDGDLVEVFPISFLDLFLVFYAWP